MHVIQHYAVECAKQWCAAILQTNHARMGPLTGSGCVLIRLGEFLPIAMIPFHLFRQVSHGFIDRIAKAGDTGRNVLPYLRTPLISIHQAMHRAFFQNYLFSCPQLWPRWNRCLWLTTEEMASRWKSVGLYEPF